MKITFDAITVGSKWDRTQLAKLWGYAARFARFHSVDMVVLPVITVKSTIYYRCQRLNTQPRPEWKTLQFFVPTAIALFICKIHHTR